jgi:predicted O-methyltransferase YrrM
MNTSVSFKDRMTELKFHPSVMAVRQMRKSLIDLYPSLQLRFNRQMRESLIAELGQATTVGRCIEFTQKYMGAGSCQIPSEIEAALTAMAALKPRILCEIGTFDGGTSLLFSRFLPTVKTMFCIDLYVKNKAFLKLLTPPAQTQHYFDMPSYTDAAVGKVSSLLGGEKIDVLFIDGDHRYEGVKKDFIFYRKLVREGGVILLHDIMASESGGRAWAGGVPKFWKELAAIYPHQEFVNSRDQQGFGIGMLTYSAAIALPAGFETTF